jgi:hypothetical protein
MYIFHLLYWALPPFLLALWVFYRFSRKNITQGYFLGFLVIFLFWQIIALVTIFLPDVIPGRIRESDPGDSFDIWFGNLVCLAAVLYTVLSIILIGMYRWLAGKVSSRGPGWRALIALGLAGFLVFLSFGCIHELSRFIRASGEYLTDLGYWHRRIIQHGLTPLYVIDGFFLVMVLIWAITAWASRRQGAGYH